MAFVQTPALDRLVKRWYEFSEDVDLAQDEILSCRKDIVLNRDKNSITGALGEAAMGQYVYHELNNDAACVPTFDESDRFIVRYEAEPLLSLTIGDKYRGIMREYDGIMKIDNSLLILECKVINSISGLSRKRRDRRKQGDNKKMRSNVCKFNSLASRHETLQVILRDLSGIQHIGMAYFVPKDTYEEAISKRGLLHDLIDQQKVYFVPFANNFNEFSRSARSIKQHAAYARWLRRFQSKYPNLYE